MMTTHAAERGAHGEREYRELSSDATKNLTGYESGTLRNLVWVCSAVKLSSRDDNLTFAHHAILDSNQGFNIRS